MASKSGSRKKSGSTRSGDAGDKDLIAELKNRVAVLENELRSKQDATSSDIAGRKRAEIALRDALSEASRFRQATENVSAYIYMKDLQSRYTYANKPTLELFGCSAEELVGCDDTRFFPPETVKQLREVDLRVFAGERTCEEINVPDTGSGRRIYLEIKTPIYADYEGKTICGLLGISTDITDRKLAEEALHKSEEKYRFLVENSKDVIWKMDLKERWTFVSSNVERVNGYRPDEMVGKPIWGFISPEHHDFIKEKLLKRMRGEDIAPYVTWSINKDGRRTPLEVVTTSITDESGKIVGVQGISRDITLRMRAEEALQESERRYRGIVEDQTELIALLDIDRTITFVNDAYCRYFGKKREELVGHTFLTLVSEEDREAVKASIAGLSRRNPAASIEQRVKRPDGSLAWMDWKNRIVFDDYGRPIGYQAVGRDITDRKLAEEAIWESERKYRSLAEQVNDWVWEIDANGFYTYASPRVRDLLGYDPGEVVGSSPFDYMAPEESERVKALFYPILESQQEFSLLENTLIKKDGSTITVETSGLPIFDDSDTFIGYRGTDRDITERKRAEQAVASERHRLFSLLDELPGFVYLQDTDYRIHYANRLFKELFGDPEKVHCYEIFYGRKEPCEECPTLQALDTNTSFEWEWTSPAGRTYHLYDYPFRETDSPPMVLELGIDITERKQIEKALEASYAYNRSLIEASIDPLVTISPDGKITDVNMATEVATGIPRDKLIGTDFFNYFTDPDMARNGYKKAFEEGSVNDYPLELRHRDGHITPVLYNATVYSDEKGKAIGVFAAARDVTERKRAEDALRESEKKFRVLAETSPAAIFLYQGDKYVYVNPMAETLTGYSRDELLAGDAWEWIHPEFLELVKGRARRRQQGEQLPSQYEVKYRARDGREGWVDFTAGLIEYGGKPAGLAMAFDVTKRKQAEEALKETKAQAELYVDLMGHDINNMNQVSMGFLELAHNIIEMDGKLGEDNIVLLDKAINSLNNSSQLIDNVRKLQREKMGLYKPEVIDVDDMIEDSIKQFRSIPGRDVKIVFTPRTHCRVRANSLLKDVFINLVGNAVKHSKGALTVSIRVDQVIDNGIKYCRVAVEDDGPGIPDQLKTTLFDRLNLTTTRARGKGFGLCLIKMLVDDYHGKFWAEDRIKDDYTKGARFMVMLPAVEK